MTETESLSAMEAELNPDEARKLKWSTFVETQLADFFMNFKLEKMSVEDGNGNKAKLSRTKDNGLKIEQSSTIIL